MRQIVSQLSEKSKLVANVSCIAVQPPFAGGKKIICVLARGYYVPYKDVYKL